MGKFIAGIGVGAAIFVALVIREFFSWMEDVYCEEYSYGDEDGRERGEQK